MIELIKEIGDFNNWHGCIGLYLTQKQLRPLKKYGVTEATTLKEVYNIIKNYDNDTTI
jgi:hypothetical protein